MNLMLAIPTLPVQNIGQSVADYQAKLGLTARHQDTDFAILVRDTVGICGKPATKAGMVALAPHRWFLARSHSARELPAGASRFNLITFSSGCDLATADSGRRTAAPEAIATFRAV